MLVEPIKRTFQYWLGEKLNGKRKVTIDRCPKSTRKNDKNDKVDCCTEAN